MGEITYAVPGISCSHCTAAIEAEVARLEGVATVAADVESKLVVVRGDHLDDDAIRAAIGEAGYEAA